MREKITKIIKSKEEIMANLTSVDYLGHMTFGILNDRPKLGAVEIPDHLWTLCGKTLEVNSTATHTHQFDYNYFDYPEEGEDRTEIPVIYFVEEWVEDVVDEDEVVEDEPLIGEDE